MELEEHRLIMVSNAEPYAHAVEEGEIVQEKLAGGLTSALDPLMQEVRGVWIAWGREEADFKVLDSDGKIKVPNEDGYYLKRLRLSEEEIDGFYVGFSNEILWPIFHSFPGRTVLKDYRYCEDRWNTYREVNQRYADAVLEELEPKDLVMIQDYHLALVPRMIRDEKADAKISLFWHIPWSSWEIFGTLPWREEIMEGLLSSDFIGFHTSAVKGNFLSCAKSLSKNVGPDESVLRSKNGRTKVAAIPLGIDYDRISSFKEDQEVKDKTRYLRKEISTDKIIIGVDRLDYTKGIPERLRAFELFLEENPGFMGKVTLVQRIPPSRRSVEEYQSILNRINRIVGEINGRFERANWTPIKSFHRFLPDQSQLIPYYLAGDVALVTPLIDGMNLVCKEYIASVDDGVLVLSEFAGASGDLKEAIQVNPYDARDVASGIKRALTMPENERKTRLGKLKRRVKKNNLMRWRDRFMKSWLEIYVDNPDSINSEDPKNYFILYE